MLDCYKFLSSLTPGLSPHLYIYIGPGALLHRSSALCATRALSVTHMASANGRYGTTGRTSGKPADIAHPAEDRETKRRRLADGGRRPGEVLLPEDLAMPPPEPPAPTPSQPESSSNGQSEPNNEKERIHLRLRGAAPARASKDTEKGDTFLSPVCIDRRLFSYPGHAHRAT